MVCVGCRYVNVGQSGTRIAVAQRCRTTMGLRLLGLAGARDQAKNDRQGQGKGHQAPLLRSLHSCSPPNRRT